MPRGWKGTVVSTPHSAQMASYRSRWNPPSPRWDLRAERQLAHRLGSLVKPLDAKNSCSPTVKTKGVPQSTQVMVLSDSSTGQFLNFGRKASIAASLRRSHNIIHVFTRTTTTQTHYITYSHLHLLYRITPPTTAHPDLPSPLPLTLSLSKGRAGKGHRRFKPNPLPFSTLPPRRRKVWPVLSLSKGWG